MEDDQLPEVLVVVDPYGTQYVIPKERLQEWWDWLEDDYRLEYCPEWMSRLAGVVYSGTMNIEEMEARRVTMRWSVFGLGVLMAGLVALAHSCEAETNYENCVDACYGMKCEDGAASCIDSCHKVKDEKN